MTNTTLVLKRSGTVEPFIPEKINRWAIWGCHDKSHLWSELSTNMCRKLPAQVTSQELQDALIATALDLARTSDIHYAEVAKRLMVADLRKRVYGTYQAPHFKDFYKSMVKDGHYDQMNYTDDQLDYLHSVVDMDRDYLFPYSGIRQMQDKYLLKTHGKIKETPQYLYMALSMAALENSPIADVVDFYHAMSLHKTNLPTPILIGLRTRDKGFASCCVISAGDSIPSMRAGEDIAHVMTANRAGIGIEFEVRSTNQPVKGGLVQHQGKLPYYRWVNASVKANTQQSRGGSATMQFPCFDPDIMTLLRLKSQRVSEENRIDTMDYSMAFNDYFISLLANGGHVALMSCYDEPEVHKAFYEKDIKRFVELYTLASKKPYNSIPASEIFKTMMQQRLDTGRIYWHNVGEANRRSTFKDPIRTSNLCQEIELPTAAFSHPRELDKPDGDGEIALCNLGGIVINRITDDEDYKRVSYLLVKAIDNVIEMQTYPFAALERSAKARRSIGIGIINLAHAMAEKGLSYASVEGRNFIHESTERMSYFLHLASVQLAKEQGKCEWFERTTYADGVLPMDTVKPYVNQHHTAVLKYDWESLRADIIKYGMRNSVLEACMPSESSSVVIGATNGVEAIREGFVFKSSKQGDVLFIPPMWEQLEFDYEIAYDIDMIEYMRSMAIIQKFVGQGISINQYYDYNKYPKGIIPMNLLLTHLIECVKLGIKTSYYCNTDVQTGGSVHCGGGGCVI